MTDAQKQIIEKKEKIIKLLSAVDCLEVDKFFDLESDKLLDEKIEVLTALKKGKTIAEIPDFYKVLELLPEKGEMWD